MRKVIIALLVLLVVGVTIRIIQHSRQGRSPVIYRLDRKTGRFTEKRFEVPKDKYPHGFPIEILDYEDRVKEGQRYISAYCRWHPDADSVIGGRVAIVPVVLYEMHHERKTLSIVGKTVTRRADGYFEFIAPSLDGEYLVGLMIERAEGCPERFKHRPPKRTKPFQEVI